MQKLQYITHEAPLLSHPELAEAACKGGVKWVQLRLKNLPENECLEIAQATKIICDRYNAIFIINDNVKIAKAVKASGVHLGKNDMHPLEARKILGNDYIIGGTANTFEDVKQCYEAGVNYVGLGPYRFTKTKKELSPILGLEGYRNIIRACQKNRIDVPIFAIGGIQADDVQTILRTGVHGIAVGTGIGLGNPTKNAQKFLEGVTD